MFQLEHLHDGCTAGSSDVCRQNDLCFCFAYILARLKPKADELEDNLFQFVAPTLEASVERHLVSPQRLDDCYIPDGLHKISSKDAIYVHGNA